MKAIAIVGYKKSGKTGLALDLAACLTGRGVKTAMAKFSEHGFDRSDADTGRMLEISRGVVGVSAKETAVVWPEKRDLRDLLPLLDAEFLVVEGGKSLDWLPRVVLAREPEEAAELDRGLALGVFGREVPGYKSVGSVDELADLALAKGFVLPGLDCEGCGRKTCGDMARDIAAGKARPDGCRSMGGEFEVLVNGQILAMNAFMAKFMAGGLKGMLSQLKGYAPGKIEIHMEV